MAMRNEEIAYQKGYRVTDDGKLIHINGKKYKTRIIGTKEILWFGFEGKILNVMIGRLQAYQKFGKELYNYRLVRHLNSNTLDSSRNNIALGIGSELISPELLKMPKTKRAFHLGYSVSEFGVLLLNGVDVRSKISLNQTGYQVFSIPYKFYKTQIVFVHRLQAYQKFGELLYQNECVRHKNDFRSDNSFDNIILGSFKDNASDLSLIVKAQQYLKSAHKMIKYPIPQRNKMREEYLAGERISDIASKYDMPRSTTRNIVTNYTIV